MKLIHMMGGGDVGGAKTHIFSLVKELNKYHEVCVISFRDGPFPEEMKEEGIRVELVTTRNPRKAAKQVFAIVDGMKPDVIHCHGGRANMIGSMLRDKCDIPIMTTIHSDYKLDYMGNPLKQHTFGAINARALRKIDFYQAVADRMAQLLISRGFPPQCVMTIYNGMDFSDPIQDFDRTAYLKESYGAEVDDSMVLCGLAARLTAVKDIETGIAGFAQAVQRQPQLRLFLAGTGEDETKLRALAQQLGVADKVIFCGWVTEMDKFFASMDITLLTSLSETFPYSILEGIREGCVPVCSDVGGMSELIISGETGYIFPPKDCEALADALAALAEDAEKRAEFAKKQYDRAAEHYSLDAMRRTQEKNYERVLAKFFRTSETDRDGTVMLESKYTAEILDKLWANDPEEPVSLISIDPMKAKLKYRTEAVLPKEAQQVMKYAQRYIAIGNDEKTAKMAEKCGCVIEPMKGLEKP